jgi:hypothetical protein
LADIAESQFASTSGVPVGFTHRVGPGAEQAAIRITHVPTGCRRHLWFHAGGHIRDGQHRSQGADRQGIITGIGFIGGGAIIKDQDRVAGTASAASIWNTGAIGLAIAFDRLEIAIMLSLLNFLTLNLFRRIKDKIEPDE